MGTSSSKSPEELYNHIVNASTSLFKSIGKNWKSETDSRFNNFFAEYRHALENGDLAFDNDIHVKHAGLENSRLDFSAFIIKKVGEQAKAFNSQSTKEAFETLQQEYAKFSKIKDRVKPELVRSHLIASWILHDDNCNGEVQLQVLRDEVIAKMEISSRLKDSIFYKLKHIPKPGIPKSKNIMAAGEDMIPFTVVADIFDQLGIWRELDVYWRMNFDNDREARVKGNFLTAFEFGKFLKKNQLEIGTVQENLRHSEELATAFGGTIDRHAFIRFLTDPELNPVIDFEKFNTVYHDMKTHPLPNYFVAASFRTYLAGSGAAMSGLCSVERYRQVLTGEGGFHGEESSFSPSTLAKSQSNAFPLASNPANNFQMSSGLDDPNSNSSTYHSCARFVEIDVWENAHGIKETYTLGAGKNTREAKFVVGPDVTCPNNLSLNEVLTTIRDSAFVKSPYPVIIAVQFTNMSLENQKLLAEDLKKGLGGEQRIYCPNTDEDNPLIEPKEWTPEALKGMFILVGRPRRSNSSKATASASASKQPIIGNQTSVRPVNTLQGNNTTSALGNQTQEEFIGVAPELHSLFFLHHFVDTSPTAIVGNAFERDHEAPKNFQNEAMSRCAVRSLTDEVAAGYSMTHPKSVAQVAYSNFIRILPSRDKWRKTMNFSPHPSWEAGAQIVSLHWQNDPHTDEPIRLYRSRFADNGKCGYLLRPDSLLKSKLPPEFFPKNSKSSSIPSSPTSKAPKSLSARFDQHQKFSLSILSAFCLPQPRSRLYENEKVSPYVIVKLEGPGHPPNRVLLRTPTVIDNAFHPSWVNQLPPVKKNQSAHSLDSHHSSNATTPRKSSGGAAAITSQHQQHQHRSNNNNSTQNENYEQEHSEFAPHCSTDIEVFIPEMSQLVIQVYHDRHSVVTRFHDENNPEAMQIENRTEQRAELDEYQLQSRGQLNDVLLAECILPVHLLNRGVRCARMRCLETGSVSTLLMVKIGELHDEGVQVGTATATTTTTTTTGNNATTTGNTAATTGFGGGDGDGGPLRSELSMLLSGNEVNDENAVDDAKDLKMEFSL